MSTAWTTPADVVARLRRRWERGEFLSAWARDVPFAAVELPLRGPSTADLSARFDEVRTWVQEWTDLRVDGVRVQTRPAGHRSIGANVLPSRVEVRGYDPLWQLLGVAADVRRFADLRASTDLPELIAWMNEHPITVLTHRADWPRLVWTLNWIASLPDRRGVYLREVPVPGVDTKFIEKRRGMLADLLDTVLPAGQVDEVFPPSQFERRYGFAVKRTLIRLRSLDPARPLLPGVTEMSVNAAEFAAVAPDVATVFIVENEITYLAFPALADAAVVFGGGFAVSAIAPLPWLQARRVVYWGDIDTHGFVALDRLRALVPHAGSMLMDRATFLAHAEQWGREPSPTSVGLPHLTDDETALYRELVVGAHGEQLRLEQERISYPLVCATVNTFRSDSPRRASLWDEVVVHSNSGELDGHVRPAAEG